MPNNKQEISRAKSGSGSPGAVSRWMQHTMNNRMKRKIRGGRATFRGMNVLILHTVGRRSSQPRESPVSWFTDGSDGWLIVASGGGSRNPDWYGNLMTHPQHASIELAGQNPVPVTPLRLDGDDRDQAWRHITTAQPRFAKYQAKMQRQYPLIRLVPQ